MRQMTMMVAAAGMALASVAATPAMAAEYLLNLTSNSNALTNYNDYSFQLDGQTIKVRATAWSTNSSNTTVQTATLGNYSSGLGVLNTADGNGSGNTHTIDNQNGQDFIVFQFSSAVQLSSITTTPYNVSNLGTDSDASVRWGNVSKAWNQSLGFDGQSVNAIANILSGQQDLLGSNAKQTRAVNGQASNLWLVAAKNLDNSKVDGFKLGAVTVKSAVPEPATWMMMIGGFALVGSAMRRRKTDEASQALA